ncbi:MAG: hypothetical protein M9953_04835 [Thermomicrobiales bacterium]|nr:hypothetical protein [Thermomicrobiales bacterium]MCO5224641.1 hypothetical protein [Thermomicrobiales bacterium]MCO5226702.1 hypothetical protein [Thermomicrobiales bacterium]
MNSLPLEPMIAPYRLRAIREFDLEGISQLYPESTAWGRSVAERRSWLQDAEDIAWGKNPKLRMVLEERKSGRALAGFTFDRKSEAVAVLRYGFRPSTAMTQIAGFVLARSFAFDVLNLIALRTDMVQGQDPLALVHEQIGYREAVRLRQWWRDAEGTALDFITYEAVNPAWEAKHGE